MHNFVFSSAGRIIERKSFFIVKPQIQLSSPPFPMGVGSLCSLFLLSSLHASLQIQGLERLFLPPKVTEYPIVHDTPFFYAWSAISFPRHCLTESLRAEMHCRGYAYLIVLQTNQRSTHVQRHRMQRWVTRTADQMPERKAKDLFVKECRVRSADD